MPHSKVAATPYLLRYSLTTSGISSEDLTQASLVADCAAGPLRTLLSGIASDTVWSRLAEQDYRISIFITPHSATNQNAAADFLAPTPGNRVLRIAASGVVFSRIELRFNHSMNT